MLCTIPQLEFENSVEIDYLLENQKLSRFPFKAVEHWNIAITIGKKSLN